MSVFEKTQIVEKAELSTREEAMKIYQKILETKEYAGKRVTEAVIMEKRGIVTGWDITIDKMKGDCFYDIRDTPRELTVVHIIPDKNSIVVAVAEDPMLRSTRAVVVYRD